MGLWVMVVVAMGLWVMGGGGGSYGVVGDGLSF